MAEITAAAVAKVREMTGVGMMECKKALTEAGGNVEAAVDLLRKQNKAKEKIAAREAREGLVAHYVGSGGTLGVLVEVNCTTDFVAKNDSFRAFASDVARLIATEPGRDLQPLVDEQITRIRENIKISRHQKLEAGPNGLIAAYIHTGAKVGVLVEVGATKEATLSQDVFKQFVKDVTLQVAAARPVAVSRDQVDSAIVAKEKEIATEQVKNKPPQAIAKIVEGKLEKFFQTNCLIDQGFVKSEGGDVTIKEHTAIVSKQLSDEIVIRRFLRFQVGETSA
jgi:elongation factor Ts